MKILQFESEVALELIENEDKLGKSDDYKLTKWRYVERYVHCFLDDIFTSKEEADFYIVNAIQRLSLITSKQQFGKEHPTELYNEIKFKVIKKAEVFENQTS